MASSLTNFVHNLVEGIHKIKCKDYVCFLECKIVNDILINCRRLSCNKTCSNKIDEELKNRFEKIFKFCSNDIDKFLLFLRKGVYPNEFMDNRTNFNKNHYQEKKSFILT